MPKTHRSRCLFLVGKTSLSTLKFVNVSPAPVCGYLTLYFHSVLLDTLNPMVSRKACFIPPDTPTVKRFSVALMSSIGLWTGLRTTRKRSSPYPYKLGLFALHSPIRFSFHYFLDSSPRGRTWGMLHNLSTFLIFLMRWTDSQPIQY